jgi:hypothetical protein
MLLLKVREKVKHKSLFKEAFGSLHALVYLRINGRYEERMQAVQQQLNQFEAVYAAKGEHALVAYFSQNWEPKKDMWVVGLRHCLNHRDHNTTSVA